MMRREMASVHDLDRGRTTSWDRNDGGSDDDEKSVVRSDERCCGRSGRSVLSAVGALRSEHC